MNIDKIVYPMKNASSACIHGVYVQQRYRFFIGINIKLIVSITMSTKKNELSTVYLACRCGNELSHFILGDRDELLRMDEILKCED